MYQLIIIIPFGVNMIDFDQGWPEFLSAAEKMPGLIKESITRIDQQVYGTSPLHRIYCFDFPDQVTLNKALVSESGEEAGKILHKITEGRVSIYTGKHNADFLDHIQSQS